MNYLCLAVQRKVAGSERGSREEAKEYFREKFGDCVKARLEAEKKRLEGRIGYYDRREEKHRGETEVEAECSKRREAAKKELKRLESQMGEGQEGIQVWNYEEKMEFDLEIQDGSGRKEPILTLCMAKICRMGSSFQVVEETWSCVIWREEGDKGVMEVRSRIPREFGETMVSLDICRESPEAIEQFRKKIKRLKAEAKNSCRAGKNGGIG